MKNGKGTKNKLPLFSDVFSLIIKIIKIMGYKTKLIIGNLGCSVKDEPPFFLKIAELKLCKCGSDSEIYKIGTSVNDRNKVIPKYKDIKRVKVYWSEAFKVDQENVVKSIFGEHNFEKGRKEEDIIELLGGDRESIKENIETLSELFEGWENSIYEDNYGDELFAIPLPVVYEAIRIDNANQLINEGKTYRRFDIALALIKSLLEGFPVREVEENYDPNLYCVLWGY
jgi:hypothetical protein